jgi:hypothetical protein
MNTTELLSQIDAEISRLQEVRSLLAGNSTGGTRGRPAGKKRHMSADARARISAAQKKRWAVWKKAKK